ncbi:MAG: pilin [Patescibacteria group bacterium]
MDFKALVTKIVTSIFDPLVVLIVALALIYFLLGVLKYIQSAGDDTKRKEGTTMMTYGIIALFVMVSVWGLVRVLQNTFPFNNNVINPPSTGSSNPGLNPGQVAPPFPPVNNPGDSIDDYD